MCYQAGTCIRHSVLPQGLKQFTSGFLLHPWRSAEKCEGLCAAMLAGGSVPLQGAKGFP